MRKQTELLGTPVDVTQMKAAIKRGGLDAVYGKLVLAYHHGKGLRLSPDEVDTLLKCDDAIERAVLNILTEGE